MPATEEPVDIDVEHVRSAGTTTRVTRLRAEEGAGDRAFVLVPGVGVSATYFEFLGPTLARRGPVYALDLPGFAGMPRPRQQPTPAFFADQVEAVLDRYGLEDPVLIGHSFGTQVVTEVLIRRPELRHAVLVSPVVNEAEAKAPVQGIRFVQSAAHESLHLALTALSAYLLCGVVYFLTVLPHMLRYRLSDRLRRVPARVLLIRGEFDRSSPRRFHARLAEAAPESWRWEIRGAAHSVINAHAIGVAELTMRHLDGRLARRGRMAEDDARVPPAKHADLAMLLRAAGSRASEWFSALRRDERGVEQAKAEYARVLWRAYQPKD